MDRPLCRLCGGKHWGDEPHVFKDAEVPGNAAFILRDRDTKPAKLSGLGLTPARDLMDKRSKRGALQVTPKPIVSVTEEKPAVTCNALHVIAPLQRNAERVTCNAESPPVTPEPLHSNTEIICPCCKGSGVYRPSPGARRVAAYRQRRKEEIKE